MSGETYVNIARNYRRLVKDFKKDVTVVFDGYKPSPKDHDHKRRNKAFSSNIVLNQNTPCTNTKARFLTNIHNTTKMILLLSDVLGRNGLEVLRAEDHANIMIVKTALRYALARDVEVIVEDTDVVCLLYQPKLELMTSKAFGKISPQNKLNIFCLVIVFRAVTQSATSLRSAILKKLCQDSVPEKVFYTFNNLRSTKAEISEAGVKLFQYLYSNIDKPLNQQRYDKYNKVMAKGVFKPEKLPPTCIEGILLIPGLAVT